MRLFILGLLAVAFFQSALLSVDLVLLVLLTRTFVVRDQANIWLAFWFGLLVSLLTSLPLGSLSIWYILATLIVARIRQSQLNSYWLVVVPLLAILAAGEQLMLWFFFNMSFQWSRLIWETALILPIYFLVGHWEEWR